MFKDSLSLQDQHKMSGTDLHEAAEYPRPSLKWEHIGAQRRRVHVAFVQSVDGGFQWMNLFQRTLGS